MYLFNVIVFGVNNIFRVIVFFWRSLIKLIIQESQIRRFCKGKLSLSLSLLVPCLERVFYGRDEVLFCQCSKRKIFTAARKTVQSNLCITTTWGTKFLWSLQTGGRYKEDLCITAKTNNSDIWLFFFFVLFFVLIGIHPMQG